MYLQITIAAFSVIIIAIVVYYFIRTKNTIFINESMDNQNTNYQNLAQQITDLQNKVGQPGPTGAQGPEGQQGQPGGTFLYQGVLRNLGDTTKVADRFYGSGNTTGLYLNTPSYSSSQYFTLTSDGLLQNQYGNCVEADPSVPQPNSPTAALNTYINTCDKTASGQKWIYDKNGRLTLSNAPAKCLTTYVSQSSAPIIANQKASSQSIPLNITAIGLAPCDSQNYPTNQQWAFY